MTHHPGLSLGSRRRRGTGAVLAAVAAVLALGAFAPAALAAPALTLTHDPDLAANPTVTVEGSEWGATGFYLAQVAIVGDTVTDGASKWVKPGAPGSPNQVELEPDGTFTTTLNVTETLGTAPDEIDCAVAKCFIATWPQHSNPTTASIFTKSRIYFAPGIEAVPAAGIAATGQTIAVNGGGVEAGYITGNGINMAQIAIVNGEVKTPKTPGPARWIRSAGAGPNKLTAGGTFESELSLSSTFTTSADEVINCGLVQCAVAFWPGHTNPTPGTLLAQQNISFAYSPSASVTPTTNLVETQQVTISGSGFNPGQPGVYVSQVAQVGGSIVFPPPGGGAGMQWIRPGGPAVNETLNPDGSFATSATVTRTFKASNGTTIDCAVVQCSVITWRAHSNPTPATLYTSAPLSFSPVGKGSPETPPSVGPSAALKKKQLKLGTKAAKLGIVVVRCGSAACSFQKPKRVAVKVSDRKLWLTVTGPKRAAAGKNARFGVRVSAGVAKQLAGKKVRVKFKVQARSDAGNRSVNVSTLLVGASGK